MPVELLFTLICDDVRIEKSNKLVIVGLYNFTINFKAPSLTEQSSVQVPAAKFALPVFTIFRRWKVDESGFTAKTEIHDPNGKVQNLADIGLKVTAESDFYQSIDQLTGFILVPGKYTIKTHVNTSPPQDYEENFLVQALP